MSQPNWATVYATDCAKLEIDTTGVYAPELTLVKERDETGNFNVYRFSLERCTYEAGILSDNPYHPEMPAWFADSSVARLSTVAGYLGTSWAQLVTALCSQAPAERAWAYEGLADYWGLHEFDSECIVEDAEEVQRRLKTNG